ncbi:RodZ domain-containing protein [Shewanella frigidimarina]|mgnify:FL=1|uniref:RodZ domain-containing protein n=1 Tax=Shewanella frigidimarina TaxID=56812 RepID=UPI003172DA8F|tara:strand:+ start:87942 stop:88919 length:978 start_codon:yes stop_codon:yes gene_type:complete
MTKEFEVEQDAEKAPLLKDVVTAGAILKAAREAKGLSLETVATQLHLRPKIINDLENDIFVNIASTTYVRGYIKNYARVVNADINQIQQCLSHQLPEIVAPAMQSFSRKTTHQARNSRLNLVTYLIVAVLIAMLVLWWVQKSSLLTNIDLSQPTVEEIAAESNMPEPQQIIRSGSLQSSGNGLDNEGNVSATDVANQAAIEAEDKLIQTAQDAATTSQSLPASSVVESTNLVSSSTTDTSLAGAESVLTIELTGDCWVNVTDANGKVMVDGVKNAAQRIEVRGIKPFKVILGAPQVASISLDGNNVSLAEFANGRVARLTLPKAS